MGEELRVDVELAHAAGDELGELAAEVEHDDRSRGRSPRLSPVAAIRGRRVEGDLEVGLDLGVVRREDAVAGVGRLAMDGLAPLAPGSR